MLPTTPSKPRHHRASIQHILHCYRIPLEMIIHQALFLLLTKRHSFYTLLFRSGLVPHYIHNLGNHRHTSLNPLPHDASLAYSLGVFYFIFIYSFASRSIMYTIFPFFPIYSHLSPVIRVSYMILVSFPHLFPVIRVSYYILMSLYMSLYLFPSFPPSSLSSLLFVSLRFSSTLNIYFFHFLLLIIHFLCPFPLRQERSHF
ncbi:hypothetical protein L228DRAFT_175588 [Xylona heveae TC161]|uniref:Uncharacterized protein n=1 Tax=Xylona heveae (strain CBS 132557 / TC161) TaxID=1328760 RepID=A0A165AKA6_XYLHT|nr:hypothetical protein L228DRAFT_175588 [Xylona heveae TC161]KZF20622.1 hypothetical protein L228DRAFT_175588 [Xylona heveae TC161]